MAKPAFTNDQALAILLDFLDDDEATVTSQAQKYQVNRETMHKLLHAKSYPTAHDRLAPDQRITILDRLIERQRGKIDKTMAERIWRLYADNPKLGKDRIAADVGVNPTTVHDIITGKHHAGVRQSASDSEQRRVRRKRGNQTSGSKLTDDEAAELLVRLGRGEFETLDDFCAAAGVSPEALHRVVTGSYTKGPVSRGWNLLGDRDREAVWWCLAG